MNDEVENSAPANRYVSRFLAIIAIYSSEMNEPQDLSKTANSLMQAYLSKDIFDFDEEDKEDMSVHQPDKLLLDHLITTYQKKKDAIEEVIKANLIEKYTFSKLDRVIRAILCLAILELLYDEQLLAKIIIDEYVSLTKTFYNNSEAGFVNKVIESIARTIRKADEF